MSQNFAAPGIVGHLVRKISTDTFYACMQCGVCSAGCPAYSLVSNIFNIRKLIIQVQTDGEGFERDDVIYACTTCNLCGRRCPRQVQTVDFIRGIRQLIAETGFLPSTYRNVLFSIRTFGNPWSEEREKRILWVNEFDIPIYRKGIDYLLYTCCTNVFDSNRKKTLIALSRLLKKAGVSFGVIGKEENCCGESIRKIGGEKDFQTLVKRNSNILKGIGAKKIITVSPHCHYTFKYEYPSLGDDVEIIHYTEFLVSLIREGRLVLKIPFPKRVSYHDPCYLGRNSKIYDAPRNLIQEIPGVQLIELSKNRESSLCCGGGGGGIWMGGNNIKLSNVRIEDAIQMKADLLASACPYCLKMLEYSNQIIGNKLIVMDVAELVNEAC